MSDAQRFAGNAGYWMPCGLRVAGYGVRFAEAYGYWIVDALGLVRVGWAVPTRHL